MEAILSIESSSSEDEDDKEGVPANKTAPERYSAAKDPISSTTGAIDPPLTKRPRTKGSVRIIPASQAPSDALVRSFPHRRGHWAGHVKIAIIINASLEQQKRQSIREFQQYLESRGHSGILIEHEDCHISLSKPFTVQIAQIESFVHKLSDLIRLEPATTIYLDTKQAQVLTNDDQSRTFWAWKVHSNPVLLRWIQHVDSVLEAYDQPTYYVPPLFHVSIASFPTTTTIKTNDKAVGGVLFAAGNANTDEEDDKDDRKTMESIGKKEDGSSMNGHEDDACSDSDSDNDSRGTFTIRVDHILCSFGTTKEYKILLKQAA